MKKSVSAFVSQSTPQPSFSRDRSLRVERFCDDDLSNAFRSELRESEEPRRKVIISWLNPEAFFDEAINSDWCGVGRYLEPCGLVPPAALPTR